MQICNNLSVSAAPSQFPWKGSQGVRTARSAAEVGDDLSVSFAASSPGRGTEGGAKTRRCGAAAGRGHCSALAFTNP